MRRFHAGMAFLLGLAVFLAEQPAWAQVLYLPTDRQTNGRKVRNAFKETATPAANWTVEIRRGRKQVAFGLVVSPDGQILTKLSEVQPGPGSSQLASTTGTDAAASRLLCQIPGGKVLEGTLVAGDEETDLALLKVDADGLKTARWADDFKPGLGRFVVTPTNGGTVTAVGIVSAQPRKILAEKVSGVLGVQLDRIGGTARIMEVFENSGAQAAGLQPGDIVQRCDDEDIVDGVSLITRLRKKKPGEEVTLRVKRDDKMETIKVTLTHPFGIFLSQFAQQNRMGTDLSRRLDGFESVFSHDGHVDPVECGGPLLDLDGRVVGINIARSGRIETLALPVPVVQRALERLQAQIPPTAPTKVSTEGKSE